MACFYLFQAFLALFEMNLAILYSHSLRNCVSKWNANTLRDPYLKPFLFYKEGLSFSRICLNYCLWTTMEVLRECFHLVEFHRKGYFSLYLGLSVSDNLFSLNHASTLHIPGLQYWKILLHFSVRKIDSYHLKTWVRVYWIPCRDRVHITWNELIPKYTLAQSIMYYV